MTLRSSLCQDFLALAIVALVSGMASPAKAPPEEEEKPSGLEIFDGALAKFEANRVALEKWQYHQTLTTEQVDAAGQIVAQGTWGSIVRPGDPAPLEYTSKRVEGRISFFEAGSEETEAESPKSGSPKTRTVTKKEENQVESAVEAVRKYNLRNRYFWKRLPDGNMAGEEAYILSFSPRPGQNTSSREERFFGLLAGRMWVSKRDFTVLKVVGALQSPCSLFWVVARVTTFRFNYELEPANGGNRLLRSSKATANTVVSFPFFKIRQKHRQTVDKYEPRTPRGSGSSTGKG